LHRGKPEKKVFLQESPLRAKLPDTLCRKRPLKYIKRIPHKVKIVRDIRTETLDF